jgi:hypothetical protein
LDLASRRPKYSHRPAPPSPLCSVGRSCWPLPPRSAPSMEPLSGIGTGSYCRRAQGSPAEVLPRVGSSLPALLRQPSRRRAQRPPTPPSRSAPPAVSSAGFLELDLFVFQDPEEGSKRFSIGGSKVISTVLYFSCVKINADFILWLINDIINNVCICLCN